MIRPVDGEDLKRFVPDLLQARYPGASRQIDFGVDELNQAFGWTLRLDGVLMTVKAAQTTHPFIWIRGGIAHAIPKTADLALRIATGNRELMSGRIYLACGDDIAMAAFDETIMAGCISLDFEPSIQDLVNRFEAAINYTREWSQTVLSEFGGRSFEEDDWGLLAF
jgi:hypothetical protein